jgi:hypothetical protein
MTDQGFFLFPPFCTLDVGQRAGIAGRRTHRAESTRRALGKAAAPDRPPLPPYHEGQTDGGEGQMPSLKKVVTSPRTGQAVPGLLIVARDQPALYRALQQTFGESQEVAVLLDRRWETRRRRSLAVPGDRRGMERRSLPHIENDLRLREYVLVRPHSRRPHD